MPRRTEHVVFEITFTDGSNARMAVSDKALLNGDQIAYVIAGERQQAKLLPNKQIKSMRRV
jgi:hypothetical protein